MRIFLAHASKQRPQADELAIKLRARDFEVFYSKDTIHPGESFDEKIREELARCHCMVFVVSSDSLAKGCYALTELRMASERWPNPRDRVLPVLVGDIGNSEVPAYLRSNVQILDPQGDFATEAADALVALRRRRRRARGWRLALVGIALTMILVVTPLVWDTVWHRSPGPEAAVAAVSSKESGSDRINKALLDQAEAIRVYTDACLEELPSFGAYTHRYMPQVEPCDARSLLDQVKDPVLVVAQPGAGKRAALEYLQSRLAKAGTPALLVSWRDCARGKTASIQVDLHQCLADELRKAVPTVRVSEIDRWLRQRSNYVLLFDAIDDSSSRAETFKLIEALYRHREAGGRVMLSGRAESLKYVLHQYAFESWIGWLRDKVTTVVVRGIALGSVERAATLDAEHQVPPNDVRTVLDFAQRCPEAKGVVMKWISKPKLFRARGTKSVSPVAKAIRSLESNCRQWRKLVLPAMFRALVWSYCHDELCKWETSSKRFIRVAELLRRHEVVTEPMLHALARDEGFAGEDEIAFPMLGLGVLVYEGETLTVASEWIPEQESSEG